MTSPATTTTCCGTALQVIRLAGSAPDPGVDMVRCGACARTAWRRDGHEVDRATALAALSAAHPAGPSRPTRTSASSPRPGGRPAARPSARRRDAEAPREALVSLLAGWQVHGS